ncbi:hypothetical protein [Geofilum rhodophaeum]|uniref:hypothetical protein n=1 Tax=Geofilum rhodophaeum TaxID=1965019 RepID=UPI0011BA80EF|nr:hypothetical protein [Geofilum rhodophaeum]
MTAQKITYLILILFSLLSCKIEHSDNEKVLGDIFPQLIDSLRINSTNLFLPPPPPLYDQDSNFIGIDTVTANLILKEYEQKLKIIDSLNPRLLIGLVDSCLIFDLDDLENRTYSNDKLLRMIVDNNKMDSIYRSETLNIGLINVPTSYELLLLSDLKNKYDDFWDIKDRRFGGLVAVSAVLFDKKKDYGLLRIETYPFLFEGAGYFLLIEKKDNSWIIKKVLNDWLL